MRGHKTYGRLDSQPSVSIKADWGQGVNTVLPGDRLPPMQFSGGLNISLREGYPLTRPGVAKAKWLYTQTASLGSVFQGGGLIQSADPDPVSKLPTSCIVVVDNDLWVCCPNTEPILLKEDITDALQPVEIIDAFDEALILRGTSQTPLRYRFEPGHFPIELPTARSGQLVLPNAETGCYAGNRVWLKVGKNEVVASDIFEWDYNTTETRWQIDDGENDEIVRLWPVGEDRIVVFKTRSIHLIEGVASLDTTTDPVIQITVRRVAAARGCVAKWGIAQRGQTLYYLGRDGLEALVLSDNAVNAMSDKPLSIAAQHYWNTLRWLSIEGAQMAIADQYLMISVPTRWREDEFIPDLLLGGRFDQEDIDVEPAAAAMTMTAYDPTIELYDATEPTNYVEFPLWYRMLYQSLFVGGNPDGTHGGPLFKGTVRFWENETVQLIGKAKYHKSANYPVSASTYPFSMWIGSTETSGTSSFVADLPTGTLASTGGDWVDIDWTGIPSPGQYVWLPYGNWTYIENGSGTPHPSRAIRIWEYPGGLTMPHVAFGPLTGTYAQHAMKLGLSRSGNDLVLEGEMSAYEGGFGQPGVGTWLWTVDVSDPNPVNWVETTFEIVDQLSGAWGAGDQYEAFTANRTIPDSDTLGYMYIALNNFAQDITSSVQIGPIFRSGRGVTTGSGIAPTS